MLPTLTIEKQDDSLITQKCIILLQILTESQIDVKGKERVQSILEEQKKTLRSLMSKPQVNKQTAIGHKFVLVVIYLPIIYSF